MKKTHIINFNVFADGEKLHPGIYLLRVLTEGGIETGKFVKR